MKSSIVLIIVSVFFILTSCNQATQDSDQTQQSPNTSSASENLMKVDTLPTQPEPVKTDNVEVSTGEEKNEVAMLNPPHGQPNHRCDIPVGAPLNSAPKTSNTTAASTTAASPATSTSTNTTTSATNTNSPAKSNETQVSSPATGAASSSFSPTVENASKLNNPQRQTTSTTANKGPKPATNPAHGQPYHRCDIAVGSPLP